ncbi:helix-turn-helix domain-containing protein, partial [Streptomyces sp. NPDC127051]|uniref:helix-turn-helix domain-containing protein n=1 Tax=Streptomyces sp. NPDC127051 TaxID=3347119 RepID=UPI00364E3BDA
MSTDLYSARVGLGVRLRALRAEAGLSGKELAARLGWHPSKVSRLENGKQGATQADTDAWAAAVGAPEQASGLRSRLQGLESLQRSRRWHLAAGHRPVQVRYAVEYQQTSTARGYEATVIPSLFQTPGYARHLFTQDAELMQSYLDTETAVAARMRRQEVLYEAGRLFRVLLWEGALHALVCPRDIMTSQLDHLVELIGMSTVELGIVPLGAPLGLTPK